MSSRRHPSSRPPGLYRPRPGFGCRRRSRRRRRSTGRQRSRLSTPARPPAGPPRPALRRHLNAAQVVVELPHLYLHPACRQRRRRPWPRRPGPNRALAQGPRQGVVVVGRVEAVPRARAGWPLRWTRLGGCGMRGSDGRIESVPVCVLVCVNALRACVCEWNYDEKGEGYEQTHTRERRRERAVSRIPRPSIHALHLSLSSLRPHHAGVVHLPSLH